MAKLFVVPTPIGNLEDFTFRAVRILEEVDLILAEDTRTSAKLMAHYQISTPMRSHHMHNEHKTLEKWIELSFICGMHIRVRCYDRLCEKSDVHGSE